MYTNTRLIVGCNMADFDMEHVYRTGLSETQCHFEEGRGEFGERRQNRQRRQNGFNATKLHMRISLSMLRRTHLGFKSKHLIMLENNLHFHH